MKEVKKCNSIFDLDSTNIIVENNKDFILGFCVVIAMPVMIIYCPVFLHDWKILFLILCCYCGILIALINKILYQSFFAINEHGFSYGKCQRFKKKLIVNKTDVKWFQIKELYFESLSWNDTEKVLVVVKRSGMRTSIRMSELPLSRKNLKSLVLKFSKRNEIFRKESRT